MSRPGGNELRERILDAAIHRFSVSGFRGTSLQDIASDIGCAKASLLYHFPNKDAILTELMAPAIATLAELDARLAQLDDRAVREPALEGLVDLTVRFRQKITVMHGELPELLRQPQYAHIQHMLDRLLAALAGRSDGATERTAALMVLAGVAGVCAESALTDAQLRPVLLDVARRTLGLP
jgi:AcrR family transcriptional regulator